MTHLESFGAILTFLEGSKMGANDPKTLDFDLQNDHFGSKIKFSQKCPGSSPKCFDDILGSKWAGDMSVAIRTMNDNQPTAVNNEPLHARHS